MARSNRLIIVVGVLLAVVAFVGTLAFLGAQKPTSAQEDATRAVLVAAEAIDVGEEVTPAKVEVRELPAEAVVGTPIADPSALGNRAAVFAVEPGGQVSQEIFGQVGSDAIDIAGQLRPGERAIAFQVDRVTGLNFVVRQGDVIDVVMSADVNVVRVDEETGESSTPEGLGDQRTVKTVLQAKRVLFVSHTDVRPVADDTETGEEDPNAPAAAPTENVIIIIAGSDQDAELLKFAQRDMGEVGAITVTLRGAGDVETENTSGVTLDRLISEYGVPVPNVVILPESAPAS